MEYLTKLLTKDRVLQNQTLNSWESAVRMAGKLLLQAGDINQKYIEESVKAAKEVGAYFVVRPGVALSHSRPGENVNRVCLSMISLEPPLCFGHPDNDPVSLLFMFGTRDNESHLNMLQELANFLFDDQMVDNVIMSRSYDDLQVIFKSKPRKHSGDMSSTF